MTMPEERTRALSQTRTFLTELCDREVTPDIPEAIRRVARRLLRHYPEPPTLDLTAAVLPQWWAAERSSRSAAYCYLELLGLVNELAGDQDVATLIAGRRMRFAERPDDESAMPISGIVE